MASLAPCAASAMAAIAPQRQNSGHRIGTSGNFARSRMLSRACLIPTRRVADSFEDFRIAGRVIQGGKRRVFAMGQALAVRTHHTAREVRDFAKRAKNAAQARRLLAIAAVLDG